VRTMKPNAADPQTADARIGPVSSLAEIPAVMGYLRRIGAEPAGLLHAVVSRTVDGYPRSIGTVRFRPDGTIRISGRAEQPTGDEQEAITAAFGVVKLPEMVTLTALAEGPPDVILTSDDAFVCHDFDDNIVMVHQRYDTREGKGFIPWTRWSDGQWHKLEPEILPFYGLPGYREKATLVLHEGAKAARRVKEIIGDGATANFPWRSELEFAHHVGWLGGVHAVDRSDWERLAACGWSRVIIVADNDDKGLRAARQIAGLFPRDVWILAFDQRFDAGFDLADEWPADLFDKRGRYVGPSMRDFLIPATKATTVIPAVGRGRPTVALRDEFSALVACTADPPRFMFRHCPSRDRRPDEFNMIVRPLSDVKDTAAKVHSRIECLHDRMVYRPGFEPGTLSVDGARCFNVFEGAKLSPLVGDPSPWLDYLEHLIPDEDERELVMNWLATLIALPKIRLRYGLLLISREQGVGKNTLGTILRALLGPQNVSFPSEGSVVDSAFNGWAARKRLIFIGEFYSGHSRKAYDKLKPLLTDDLLEVNEKGVNQYELENWATVIACSNSEAALHLDDEDRRWFVPTVTESKKPPAWWEGFYQWFESDGLRIILSWALDRVANGQPVRTGDHAPWSKRKRMISEESRSEGQKLAVELAEHLATLDRRIVVRTRDIRAWIARKRGLMRGPDPDLGHPRLERPATILMAVKRVPRITVWANEQRPKFGATRDSVVMNFVPGAAESWAEIKQFLSNLEGGELDEPL
jgi:hypothetical protein